MLDSIGIHCDGFDKNPIELHWKSGGVHCAAIFKLFVTKRYCGASSQLRHCCHQKADDGRFLNSCAFQLKPDCVAITGIASLLLTICFVLESKKLNIQLQTKSCLLVGNPSSRQLSQSKGQSIVSMMIRRNRFYCCAVFL